MPVGKYNEQLKPFSTHSVELIKGDIIYTFTDGYADQFGGPNGKIQTRTTVKSIY